MMDFHHTPPLPGIPKPVAFPGYFSATMQNGLRVLVIEHRSLPIISLRLVIRSGSTHDGTLNGLAGMTAELLTKSTQSRSAKQIADEIDYVGGQLGTGADWDGSFITVNILRRHLDTGLSLLKDISLHPTFPAAEVERTREQHIASIIQRNEEPDVLAEREFARAVFGSHPYGSQLEGTVESIVKIRRDDLSSFHSTFYRPNNAILAVVGDISPDEAMDTIAPMFAEWGQTDLAGENLPTIGEAAGVRVVIVDKPESVQSAIRLGHVGISRKSAEYIPAYVLNTLFGGYFQSRINRNLREEHGYTYGAHSIFDARQAPGPFVVSVDVRNEATDLAIAEILGEMRRIRDEHIGDDELNVVKSYLIGSFPLQIETASQIASKAISIELYGLPGDYFSRFNENVAAITADDLRAVALRRIHPESAVIAISGNAEQITPRCANFGPVTVVDAEGNQKS